MDLAMDGDVHQRLRAQGLRPIQIWAPDVRSPRFTTEARRQTLLANAGSLEAEDQAFVDAIFLWPDQAQE
ncbi:antitoxin MazE family protein [Cyanobium sp. Candia 9D4]|uniref:antitoxin MazE family protein n=1 Tax=Cyanobium sp. Candia 9D4 TaxID=2823707 RepID=UPI0020CF9D6F|nr:antitoxin MazE family protein [Cyanobium sp. Candia 9D4]MCP9934222.1 antitoxin MazE family protein [Cyanobium sp. Candia 9D4]